MISNIRSIETAEKDEILIRLCKDSLQDDKYRLFADPSIISSIELHTLLKTILPVASSLLITMQKL